MDNNEGNKAISKIQFFKVRGFFHLKKFLLNFLDFEIQKDFLSLSNLKKLLSYNL